MSQLIAGIGDTVKLWDTSATPTADDVSDYVFVPGGRRGGRKVTIRYYFGTQPSAFTLTLQSSPDASTWSTLATYTNLAGDAAVVDAGNLYVRGYITANTGGANLTLELTLGTQIKADDSLMVSSRMDMSGLNVATADTDGFVYRAGTSAAPVSSSTTAGKFVSWYFTSAATSGSIEGFYVRTYLSGAGTGTVQALRAFTSVNNVAASNARGAHISLNFQATGRVTGLGTALECTLHIPNQAWSASAGTLSAIKAAINSDGASSDPVNSRLSVFNVVSQGDATGAADVDTDCSLFDIQGFAAASGITNMISSTSLAELPASGIGIRIKVNDVIYYIPAVVSTEWN
jgi:hypothetical protein